jgi:ATP-binding cassette, subfamily B, bacterial
VLDGTIRYNLIYGLTREEQELATDEELWSLMRLLKIDFGERLIDGLDTLVGRNGMKLSGGQAQRLMIGAAAMKKPRFMVIDEATSSLDSTTEKAVQYGLAKVLAGNVGALVVAHRLSTVRHLCNRFIVLREVSSLNGGESQVEAIADSFEELYGTSPTFRRLADDQGVTVITENYHFSAPKNYSLA